MCIRDSPKGSRVGILSNGSPLFNGGAGSGWSNIRKHMLDNDLLDAIIALPGGLFYGTGIATYLWIFDNKKPESHKNKVLPVSYTHLQGFILRKEYWQRWTNGELTVRN